MRQCWRWFGPNDPTKLADLHMVGVEGIVTALHDLPPGEVWTTERINDRKQMIENADLTWDVIESLPVSETIKTQGPETAHHIDAYKESLRNLAAAGLKTVCYNFMPILDWTRTMIRTPQPHGGTAMSFDLIDFAVFDVFILERRGAENDYSDELRAIATTHFESMSDARRSEIGKTIVMGLPGANDGWSLQDVRDRLAAYDGIDTAQLQRNLIDFLAEVAPVADDLGMRLCCHPDDPPWPLLGLPRVMSSTNDYETVLNAVDLAANGATLCTGSLGVASDFDAPDFVRRLGPRIHFAHLRNTKRTTIHDANRPNFFEAPHLAGDTDMPATIKALIQEEARRKREGRSDWRIPMRPDHGQELLNDRGGKSLPGYPLLGRMRGLAELRGVMAGVEHGLD